MEAKIKNIVHWSLPVVFVVLINFLVYWPALFHAARGDQIIFLKHTAKSGSLSEMLSDELSYTRAAQTQRGDDILFRPVLDTALVLQRWWYGCQFWKWQLTAIIIHLLVLFQMRRLMNLVEKSHLGWLFIANFSIFYIGQEMVIWQHISFYMVSLLLLVEAFLYFFRYLYFPQKYPLSLWKAVFFLTAASLIFEFGLVVDLIMVFGLLAIRSGWIPWLKTRGPSILLRDIIILGTPIVIYMLLSASDYCFHHLGSIQNSLPAISWQEFIFRCLCTLLLLIDAAAFPVFIQIKPLGRSLMEFFDWSRIPVQVKLHPWLASMDFLMVVLLVILIIKMTASPKNSSSIEHWLDEKKQRLSMIKTMGWFTLTLAVGYLVMLIVGRSRQPFFYIQISLYHFYMIGFLLSVCAFSFWSLHHSLANDRGDLQKNLLSAVLITSILLNASQSFAFNLDLKEQYWPWARFMGKIDSFVMSHKKEDGFSFDIIWQPSSSSMQKLKRGETVYRYQYQPYFAPFVNKKDPKYLLLYKEDGDSLTEASKSM